MYKQNKSYKWERVKRQHLWSNCFSLSLSLPLPTIHQPQVQQLIKFSPLHNMMMALKLTLVLLPRPVEGSCPRAAMRPAPALLSSPLRLRTISPLSSTSAHLWTLTPLRLESASRPHPRAHPGDLGATSAAVLTDRGRSTWPPLIHRYIFNTVEGGFFERAGGGWNNFYENYEYWTPLKILHNRSVGQYKFKFSVLVPNYIIIIWWPRVFLICT